MTSWKSANYVDPGTMHVNEEKLKLKFVKTDTHMQTLTVYIHPDRANKQPRTHTYTHIENLVTHRNTHNYMHTSLSHFIHIGKCEEFEEASYLPNRHESDTAHLAPRKYKCISQKNPLNFLRE